MTLCRGDNYHTLMEIQVQELWIQATRIAQWSKSRHGRIVFSTKLKPSG